MRNLPTITERGESCQLASKAMLNPTFRSKISDFIIFPAIDFQSNADLLNFYAKGKSNYMVYYRD